MQYTKLFQPDYADDFRCIGSACEDSCCEEWTIYVDQDAFEKYKTLPAGPLRTIIDKNILRTPEAAQATGDSATANFAKIRLNASHKCPLLSADGLCQIQTEHGEEFLPQMCANYPRITYRTGGAMEKVLSLSCPEAARIVLLNPQLLNPRLLTSAGRDVGQDAGQDAGSRTGGDNEHSSDPWLPYFWPIRDFALALVQNRIYPLWQRLFLLDLFSRRFDAIAPEQRSEKVPQLLAEFETTAAAGNLQAAMNNVPADHAQQLDLVLRLAGMLLHQSYLRPRFVECIQAFTQGIGNGEGATLESLTARYAMAHGLYYEPFFQKHPHILENYLVNTIFRCRFPFGRDWAQTGVETSMTRESTLLAAQFALMKGLLIGVAGFHREAFSVSHVVHTVQAASKHFEHHTDFLKQTHALLVESRMDGQLGLAVLLRNAESHAPWSPIPAIHAPEPAEGTMLFPVHRRPGVDSHLPGPTAC
jgi:lysine-N-methylase